MKGIFLLLTTYKHPKLVKKTYHDQRPLTKFWLARGVS